MKRKWFSLCLALSLCLVLAAVPAQAASPAVPSAQDFLVDGGNVETEVYNIGGNNYFKLRDIAMLLRGTESCFSVDYDDASRTISLVSGEAYVPDGTELRTGVDRSASCVPSSQRIVLDGSPVEITAYNIGGNNFFKLRDLGEALRFCVDYDSETNTAIVESAYYIRHTDLSQGYPVLMYFEVPVFKGNSAALQKINAELAAVEQEYIRTGAPDALDLVRESMGDKYGPTAESPYQNERPATVCTCTDELISVTIDYLWCMGGVFDYGADSYNYNAKTGERIYLNDLIGGTDDQIREVIIDALLAQYPGIEEAGVTETPMDAIRGMDVRDIDFCVRDGVIHVLFDKYEISYGAAGAFDVSLSGALQPLG
ncbi:MAG: hypothetical protein IKD96_02050 [Oscillospiraceae bacterium]|nr:hypothetical protein [Oscillospiraceae bacterium]